MPCSGELERLQGKLDKAEALCLEAESLASDLAREAYKIHGYVCRDQGRLVETLELTERASQVGVLQSFRDEPPCAGCFQADDICLPSGVGQIDQALARSP